MMEDPGKLMMSIFKYPSVQNIDFTITVYIQKPVQPLKSSGPTCKLIHLWNYLWYTFYQLWYLKVLVCHSSELEL